MKESVHSNYSHEMGIDAMTTAIQWPDLEPKPAQKGDKGFLRSGLSAITSSLSRRLSYQPPHTKSAKLLKPPQELTNV